MNFPRFNKMKGMGQIVSWSVRDETLHCLSVIRLFRTFVQENPEIWTEEFKRDLYLICATIVDHEDAFIDLAFELGGVQGLTAADVKQYIRFIADRRLTQLGLEPLYHVEKNPLPWLDEMLNAIEHTNFFENRATEYSKASTEGTWEEAFAGLTFTTAQPEGELRV
jgi:ribonucleoside-diphosphate reductase beta chain